ncbi:MAG: MraY family glycosyltransferase [Gammaproteobacteria bacterium]|nr:MraY family glycosyltransferase [Gammaproteobacteria bacterium]
MALFLTFITAMFITMLLIPPLMRSAHRLQIVDMPNDRKVHTGAIPRIGGIAMVAGAIMPIVIWMTPDAKEASLLWGMAIIFIFGIWDDRKDLDYRIKFFGQTLAVFVVVFIGDVVITTLPAIDMQPIPWFISYPLTILFLLGITNAINLADGLDGLAGGTALLSLGVIALLAYMEGDVDLLLISLAILGSILGFLRFNTHPARVFMGDGGSQFLGFSVGVLVLLLTQHENAPISAALPLLLLGLPILDTVMVMVTRVREGRSPFSPDKNHIHHRLLALGFTHYEAVFTIYVTQAALVLTAYSMCYESDITIMMVFIVFCASVIACFRYATIIDWQFRGMSETATASYVGRALKWLHAGAEGKITFWASILAAILVSGYFVIVAATVSEVSKDLGLLAAGLFMIHAVRLAVGGKQSFSWLERACVYSLCAVAGYLSSTDNDMSILHTPAEMIFYVVLAVTVVIGFRFSMDRAFMINTLDFLVIFAVFTVPNLPGQVLSIYNMGEFLAKLIVLFYAIELILTRIELHWRLYALRTATVAAAGWIGLRGIAG